MQVPDVLLSLTDQGVIDEVLRPLKSGKEAQVYLVSCEGESRVAKVYKDAQHRSFKQRAQYMEGRRVRNTRDQRAMTRRTRHGKAQEENAWKSAEVNVIQRLHAHGVRVPTPYNFIDGVLIMELVQGDDGHPAPRLGELAFDRDTAHSYFQKLLSDVIKMLCAGIVHGDLSEYNVLVDGGGPVVIDFPQSVDAAQNRNAKKLLLRDVDNLSGFLSRCVPGTQRQPYGEEIWAAYESNTLTPDLELTGKFKRSTKGTNMGALLDEIEEASRLEQERRAAMGDAAPKPRRREVIMTPSRDSRDSPDTRGGRRGRGGQGGSRGASGRGASGRAAGGQRASGQSSERRQQSEQEAEGPAKRGNGRRRPEGGPRGESRDGARDANREQTRAAEGDAPPKRRRRRRGGRGGRSGTSDQQTEGGQGRDSNGGGRGQGRAPRPSGDGPSKPAGGRTPEGRGASPRPAGASGRSGAGSESGADGADAPKAPRRRRRRRRRGPGAPSGESPSPERAKPRRSDDAE